MQEQNNILRSQMQHDGGWHVWQLAGPSALKVTGLCMTEKAKTSRTLKCSHFAAHMLSLTCRLAGHVTNHCGVLTAGLEGNSALVRKGEEVAAGKQAAREEKSES